MSGAEQTLRPCAVCGILVSADSIYRPFCSKRCQQIDLGRWASGDYSIAGELVSPWTDGDETEH
ncbi:MAG: DNA gyrase inhibitor YacG [Mariprofundaceae bacterium]|nr:DNA gyrase inhibitor YacG [Mariprofundaceae bacterium]